MLVLLAHSLSAPLLECTPICSYELLRGHCPALRWESGGEEWRGEDRRGSGGATVVKGGEGRREEGRGEVRI